MHSFGRTSGNMKFSKQEEKALNVGSQTFDLGHQMDNGPINQHWVYRRTSGQMDDRDTELSFRNVEFELPVGHPEKNTQNANKNTGPSRKNKIMTGDIFFKSHHHICSA